MNSVANSATRWTREYWSAAADASTGSVPVVRFCRNVRSPTSIRDGVVDRQQPANPGAPEQRSRLPRLVRQREDWPAGAQVFIDLGRHGRIGRVALKQQQTVRIEHLPQRRLVAYQRCEFDDVSQLQPIDQRPVRLVMARRTEDDPQLGRQLTTRPQSEKRCQESSRVTIRTGIKGAAVDECRRPCMAAPGGRDAGRASARAKGSGSKPFAMTSATWPAFRTG